MKTSLSMKYLMLKLVISGRGGIIVYSQCKKVKVKVSHSLIAVGAVGVRVPLYLGHSCTYSLYKKPNECGTGLRKITSGPCCSKPR